MIFGFGGLGFKVEGVRVWGFVGTRFRFESFGSSGILGWGCSGVRSRGV